MEAQLTKNYNDLRSVIQSITRKIKKSGSQEWFIIEETNLCQILYVYAIDDRQIPFQVHTHEGFEHFVVLSGKVEINGGIYASGDIITIKPQEKHYVTSLTPDLTMLAFICPPEPAYR
jgi:quercetin dioxygenase-like cupin family protein